MIMGIGIDLVEVDRIRRAVANERFIERVYTKTERQYCDSRGRGAVLSYAARFAGKEAVMKALGVGLSGGAFTDIEIVNDELGAPLVKLSGGFAERARVRNVTNIHISLTHVKEYAAAECIAEGTA